MFFCFFVFLMLFYLFLSSRLFYYFLVSLFHCLINLLSLFHFKSILELLQQSIRTPCSLVAWLYRYLFLSLLVPCIIFSLFHCFLVSLFIVSVFPSLLVPNCFIVSLFHSLLDCFHVSKFSYFLISLFPNFLISFFIVSLPHCFRVYLFVCLLV